MVHWNWPLHQNFIYLLTDGTYSLTFIVKYFKSYENKKESQEILQWNHDRWILSPISFLDVHTIEIFFLSRGWGSFHVNDDDYRVFVIISCCIRWFTIIAGDFSGAWFLHRIRLWNQNADHALAEGFTKLKIYAPWVEHKIGIYTEKLQCVNGAATWLCNCTQNAHTTEWRNHNLKSHDGAKYRCHCFLSAFFISRKCILMHPSVNFLQITSWQMVMTRGFCET